MHRRVHRPDLPGDGLDGAPDRAGVDSAHQALPRFVDEEEVGAAVSFVLSSRTMTGTILEIDAGGFPPRVRRSRVTGR
ncbi:hypothetical protein [uncultured Propionibacterium sp.]|uniref:hypothetical protein n=1 Tax=uncultured Propionibacterium sp. TaxID=218066 RepID=UPI0029318B9A|nr:hypothetical protein [uncultured Propionibacterium sp.]